MNITCIFAQFVYRGCKFDHEQIKLECDSQARYHFSRKHYCQSITMKDIKGGKRLKFIWIL